MAKDGKGYIFEGNELIMERCNKQESSPDNFLYISTIYEIGPTKFPNSI